MTTTADPSPTTAAPPDPPFGHCSTCTTAGRRGTCALGRCYCGHETCWAFASFAAVAPTEYVPPAPAVPNRAHRLLCPAGAPIADDGSCCGETHDTRSEQ